MSSVLELAQDLISRASVTPEDAGCQQIIADRLQASGFDVEWFYCEDVSNVLITHGQGSPSLWFLGHTDVVPTGPVEDWTSPPFEPEVREGLLYGRGAADMKGAVAAMVTALEQFVEAYPGHQGQAGLLLTSDEEGIAQHGIRAVAPLLKKRGIVPDHCLVGEPSSQIEFGDTVRIGRRGSIMATLEVRGVQGHTAFASHEENPVHRLAPFLAALTSEAWDEGDGDFPPTRCQVSNINAGTGADNVTPGKVVLKFSIRNSPASPADQLRIRITDLLERHGLDDYDLGWRISGEPFISAEGPLRSAVRSAVSRTCKVETSFNTGGGTSDGRFIAPLGAEVVEFGLLNRTIHQVDEHASISDLEQLESIYRSVLAQLLP